MALWIALHLLSENLRIDPKWKQVFLLFLFLFFSLTFFRSMCFPSYAGNVITYFKVISYKTIAFFFSFPNLKWNGVSVLIILEYSSSILCFSAVEHPKKKTTQKWLSAISLVWNRITLNSFLSKVITKILMLFMSSFNLNSSLTRLIFFHRLLFHY